MLAVGFDDKSSASRINRFVKRESPNTAPPNSSFAHATKSVQNQKSTAYNIRRLVGNGVPPEGIAGEARIEKEHMQWTIKSITGHLEKPPWSARAR
ncbi:hypothetical protein sS8_4074 [Methylocaldum marinum]|uniref:Uncharacterized protein n=1 Tax=Methylocaldum marinum TaxID=1432792 RepID=A0A250KWW0_9GAMM|nr:hypothetical protein sS8_4074 [Methylocaldum marinum]